MPSLVALSTGAPVGSILSTIVDAAPYGYVRCDGAALSRSTYAALFSAIGVTYGAGDGSTTFNVPDFRGVFLRGLDSGRGIDTGRTIASYQADDVQPHTHNWYYNQSTGGTGGSRGRSNGSGNTTSTGGAETRPKNHAVVFWIRY